MKLHIISIIILDSEQNDECIDRVEKFFSFQL